MQNPTINVPIDNKLVLSSAANVYLGSGIKTFQVNPDPVADLFTQNGYVTTTGAKYITGATGTQITIGNLLVNTTAKTYEVFATVGLIRNITIVGVNNLNEEITESITTNGVTVISTINTYKCVNDIILNSGGNVIGSENITCRPSGATPQDQRVVFNGVAKQNPYFMLGSKGGLQRKARLKTINSFFTVTSNTNLIIHIFRANVSGGGGAGIFNPPLRMYDLPTTQGINFGDDGCVELNVGEIAVFYRDSGISTETAYSATWSIYNIA